MEVDLDPLAFHPLMPERTNSTSRHSPKRSLSARSHKLPMKASALREARLRRTPPQPFGGDGDLERAPKTMTAARPLVPTAERRSGDDGKPAKVRKEVEVETWDITPDGGSAGREGRQFRVANVGNNGKIYLRPMVRPANQRYPQPNFVFPATPPSTAEMDALKNSKAAEDGKNELRGSLWTPMTAPSSPGTAKGPLNPRTPTRPSRHRRAMSDSTVREGSIAHESELGGFKVVITKPQDQSRPKTTEDMTARKAPPLLHITIPTWKLGTPRFTLQGTPVIQPSSYAPTEDHRSSKHSFPAKSQKGELNSLQLESLHPRPSPVTPHVRFPSPERLSPLPLRFPVPTRATYLSTHLVIVPAMFDALTFKPACDDRSIVRYSPASGAVTAATPPRLVAEITSPSFLDYELISDFFLTFRAFLDTTDLLRMLIARLKWALSRDDETGMVVRVRTFVAIRHWVLNYFVDDFVVDYYLRVTFCNLLNDFVEELSGDARGRKVQIKILAELKKCWRRVGAQYWDGPEFDSNMGAEVPIAPGGIAGHRNPALDPSFWATDPSSPPRLYDLEFPEADGITRIDTSFYNDVNKAGHIDSDLPATRPRTSGARPGKASGRQRASPTSIASLDVVSCTFPTKGMRIADPDLSHALTAHPVDPSSIYNTADPIASTPRALSGKRVRPQTAHKRSNSITDSLREHGIATEKVVYKNAEFLLTLPYAGSLVRGNLLPPGQAFVEIMPPSSAGASRDTTVFQPCPVPIGKDKSTPSAMSGAGMRRLINSVRKALRSRGQGVSPTQGNFLNMAPIGPRGVTTNRLPGTAVVPQARPRHPSGFRAAIRIDMLGAEIAEDFKKAVREDAAEGSSFNDIPTRITGENIEYSAALLDSTFDPRLNGSSAGLTAGSKSIVIVDGTLPSDLPAMTGALPVMNSSVEAFADSFMPQRADLTPPNTPPAYLGGNTPRRSSLILSNHVMQAAQSADVVTPHMLNLSALASRPSEDSLSIDQITQSPNRPPLSSTGHHKRQQSSRSYRSRGSIAHRRWASFHSALPQPTVRSFDATTYSEGSVASEIKPSPLRVLRRRPGGDLRGVQNVADLNHAPLHRSRSTGSLTTYSDSVRSSYLRSPICESSGYVDVVSSDYSQHRDVFSLGALAANPPKHQLSLFSTHSSKPLMRPSFELEAQKLAQIPDDVDDDGGVESALAKLEGKYEKKVLRLTMEPRGSLDRADSLHSTPEKEKRKHRHQHVVEDGVLSLTVPREGTDTERSKSPAEQISLRSELRDFLSEDHRESYSSIPLLDRGLTEDGRSKTTTQEWTNQSILEGPSGAATPRDEVPNALSSVHLSYEVNEKKGSLGRFRRGDTVPKSTGEISFLDGESDNDSDLSTELSIDVIDTDELGIRPVSVHANTNMVEQPSSEADPPSPPVTFTQAVHMSPESAHVPRLHEHQLWGGKPLPPTPEATPTTAMHQQAASFEDGTGTRDTLRKTPALEEPSRKFSAHLPFILAFDSEVLAQQFTLIEKDALNEIDWKELIDMRWKNAHTDSRSWVHFLRNSDARGVEVVVARFNIMVKWAISEIVLCQDQEERARCIIKFIHIAAHCRRHRNFATMNQIAIALTSNEVARLAKTWAMVPPSDLRTLQELEILVSPTKNFYNLRAEMEGGATAADTGCIPFVGIYTHDLLFNSQRPSEIASSPTTAPLVNFERCRIAASVVKTLLRLLEASTLYQFQPIEGITERCLWMSALSDDEIRRHSESLEP